MRYDLFTYKKYLSPAPSKTDEAENNILIICEYNFSYLNMAHNENYELKVVCVEGIFKIVRLHSNRFETENQFTQWTKKEKANYTQGPFFQKKATIRSPCA
ncbi:unnamed protein product [Rhizopus microsporus]